MRRGAARPFEQAERSQRTFGEEPWPVDVPDVRYERLVGEPVGAFVVPDAVAAGVGVPAVQDAGRAARATVPKQRSDCLRYRVHERLDWCERVGESAGTRVEGSHVTLRCAR